MCRAMASHVGMRSLAARATIPLAALALLGGCGSSQSNSSASAAAAKSCPETVVEALSHVVRRVYREGIASERTSVARRTIAASTALRQAVEAANPVAVRAAAEALVAGGHMTNLLVMRGTQTLADVGGPAVAPLAGTLIGAHKAPIATYRTSVWSDAGLLAESGGIAEGRVSLRVGGRSVGGSLALPPGKLAPTGRVVLAHVPYEYASFGGKAFPSGQLRVYVLRPLSSITPLCGATSEDTTVNTMRRIARLIYDAEGGRRTLPQVQRVQADQPLLAAVARHEPAATKTAVERLLNQHIVRLRVSAVGHVLADVGGPYVLAPVTAPLVLGGRTIGSFVLSIQDDEGYLRLTRRLVGLRVLMYMDIAGHPTLVKNSLGPQPGTVPASGSYSYRGSDFHVFTLHASAFPAGPLTIRVLVPIPYT
jgi:protein-disulfide isomerase-like protein with CxxC motif